MNADNHFQVIVIGAGMVGAGVVLALARAGIKVTAVEAGPLIPGSMAGESGYEPRVSAINRASRNWLNYLGIWSNLESRCQKVQGMKIWEQDGTAAIQFDALTLDQSDLGCIIENLHIQTALGEALYQSGLHIFTGCKLEQLSFNDNQPQVTLTDGTCLTADLVIGADGANSRVRELAGLEDRPWDYRHKAIITTVGTEQPHGQIARQIFRNTGPLAFLPLPDPQGKACSIVWSCVPDEAERLMALSDVDFRQQLATAIEHQLGQITSVDKRYAIPLAQNHAQHYIKPGIALIGDAAHRIHPLAGQGVNLGFLDAAALTEVLLEAHQANMNLGDLFYLRKYQRQRQSHNLAMMAGMEGFKRLFEADPLPIRWLRNWGMKTVNQQPWLKREIARFAGGEAGPVPTLARAKQQSF